MSRKRDLPFPNAVHWWECAQEPLRREIKNACRGVSDFNGQTAGESCLSASERLQLLAFYALGLIELDEYVPNLITEQRMKAISARLWFIEEIAKEQRQAVEKSFKSRRMEEK